MKMLIIDDSGFTRSMMKKLILQLRPEIEVLEAGGGKQGIELFDQHQPDLVLTDLLMPDLPGLKVIEHIRSRNKTCFISVLSSDIQQASQEEVKHKGADIFIPKPITPQKLQQVFQAFQQR